MFQVSLKAARVNAGKTQKEVAAMLGVSNTTVIAWETGKSSPRIDQMRRMCDIYGAPIDAIFLPKMSTESEIAEESA